MIHRSRTLRQRIIGIKRFTDRIAFKGWIPSRQRIHIISDTLFMRFRRDWLHMPFCTKLKLCQRLGIQLEDIFNGSILQTHFNSPILPVFIGMFEVTRFFRQMHFKETTIVDICLNLIWIWLTATVFIAFFATPASQWPYSRFAFVVSHIVSIVFKFGSTIFIRHARKPKTRTQFNQDRLEPTHISIFTLCRRINHRPTN